jgi:hypothetical protein
MQVSVPGSLSAICCIWSAIPGGIPGAVNSSIVTLVSHWPGRSRSLSSRAASTFLATSPTEALVAVTLGSESHAQSSKTGSRMMALVILSPLAPHSRCGLSAV